MKVAILAGGLGTRLAEETELKPKPMVDVGGEPILSHLMRFYASQGFDEFVVALGYKGHAIKRYFVELTTLGGSLSLKLGGPARVDRRDPPAEGWQIDLIETGVKTQTGGRIKQLRPFLGEGTFMLTWGDGLSDVDLQALLAFHRSHGKLATVTAVRPPARFGHLEFDGDRVVEFSEKPQTAEGWINGAFFVLEPGVFDYIEDDRTAWEREPMEGLARDGQLMAYRHDGFWQCMDTLRDKKRLERLVEEGSPPWKRWEP